MHFKSVTFAASLLMSAHAAAMAENPTSINKEQAKDLSQALVNNPTPKPFPLALPHDEMIVAGTKPCPLGVRPDPMVCN
ncbi:hypothetical protein D3C77_335390 [compost metagenome]